MHKLLAITLAALCLLPAASRAAEPEADAAVQHIRDAREILAKSKAWGHGGGWFTSTRHHLDMTIWLISHGRELRSKLGPSKFAWSNPQWKLPATTQKYDPKDAELAAGLALLEKAHDELKKSPFNGKTYGYFGIAFETLNLSKEALRNGAHFAESHPAVVAHGATPPAAAIPAKAPAAATPPAAIPAVAK